MQPLMRRLSICIVVVAMITSSAVGCSPADRGVTASSSGVSSEATTVTSGAGNGVGEEGFIWHPELGRQFGSDVANRSALGIVDGEGGILYFQAPNGNDSLRYSLYSFDEETGETEELVADCYGMVNAVGDSVFYIGEVDQGVFRYDIATKRSIKEYDGVVLNLLALQGYLYIVNGGKELIEVELASGNATTVMRSVAGHYLEYVDGSVYFAQESPDVMNCNLFRVAVGSPRDVVTVYEGIPHPIKMVGKSVLYGDDRGAHLIDLGSGRERTVCSWGGGVGPPAANGNGVFYITSDADGYAELSVFDVDSGRTSMLMPVHGGAVYFVDGEILLVSPVNFDIERVILDVSDPRTELVLKGDSQAR